jgi:hypothetical protein
VQISEAGSANKCVDHMLEVLTAARRAKLRVFYAMHRRYRPGDLETWKYLHRFRKGHGNIGPSNSALAVASSAPNSCQRQVKL